MNHKKSKLTAYCGLYCADCIRFKCRASDLSESLLDEIKNKHFLEYAQVKKKYVKEFEQFEILPTLLKAISEIKCGIRCRAGGDGCGGLCPIIAYVKAKNIDGCWDCDDFETCSKLKYLIPFHGISIKANLRLIKKHGVTDWVKFREKIYPWFQYNKHGRFFVLQSSDYH